MARGFQQVEGQHYDDAVISSPVTSDMTIRTVLTIKQVAGYDARVIDVKGAFLKGDFENNEEIYMTIPEGFEKYYPKENTWLQIMKPIYGLKQAGLYYYQKAKRAMQENGFEQSNADPCLQEIEQATNHATSTSTELEGRIRITYQYSTPNTSKTR